jgi:hypothetical protein
MSVRCVALLSGGLDSMLAIRLMQQQQIEVHALNFQTIFTCCRDDAAQAARRLGVPLTVLTATDDYLELVRRPRFGYGRGANPCIDCRIAMFQQARQFMQQIDARFVVSGEVVGQRPMSQKRRDLDIIARHSGLDDLLLRPLSARLLPDTRPEREAWVDSGQLGDFSGRSRKGMIALARKFGFPDIPEPSTGCALTEVGFSRKVFDLIEFDPQSQRWDFELLRVGRHFRFGPDTKIIVGRHADDNARLQYLSQLPEKRCPALLEPRGFPGPTVLITGTVSEASQAEAIALMLRHSRAVPPQDARIVMTRGSEKRTLTLPSSLGDPSARSITAPPERPAAAG